MRSSEGRHRARSRRHARRGVRRYYLLRSVGWLANQLLQFAVPVLMYRTTGSVAWSGVALFVEWTPRLVALPLAGSLVDRVHIRRVYLASDVLRCRARAGTAVGT